MPTDRPAPDLSADLSQSPDEDLMLLIAQGFIEQAAAELFRRHNRALFNFVAWLCQGNVAEAEDITQRAWIKLLSRCGDYRPEAAFRTFLYQIARNTFLDLRKSSYEAQREVIDEAHELPADDISPEHEFSLQQNMQRVRSAMMALPAPQREVVVLRFFSDMSLEDIAATLGEGYETVKSRLRYAFARLRRELEDTA